MFHVQGHANGALLLGQQVIHRRHAGLLHEAHHLWCGEHFYVAAAQVFGRVGLCHHGLRLADQSRHQPVHVVTSLLSGLMILARAKYNTLVLKREIVYNR